jgi:hypothetical protein
MGLHPSIGLELLIGIDDGGAINPQSSGQGTFGGQTSARGQLARENHLLNLEDDLSVERDRALAV